MVQFPPDDFQYETRDAFLSDCALLRESDLFDEEMYRKVSGIGHHADAAEHYLRVGWLAGLEPSPDFNGAFQYPYFRTVGFSGPPAITHLVLCAAGWSIPRTYAEAERGARLLRYSEFFDTAGYRSRVGRINHLDPALHYLLIGENMGFAPSLFFDPNYYGEVYPDVAEAGQNRLLHYLGQGRREGRRIMSIASRLQFDRARLRTGRGIVLVIGNQTGTVGSLALISGLVREFSVRYDIITLILAGREIDPILHEISALLIESPTTAWHPIDLNYLVGRLLNRFKIEFAIALGVESQIILKPLSIASIPVVTIIDAIPSGFLLQRMDSGLEWSTAMAFSENAIAAAAEEDFPYLQGREVHVLSDRSHPRPLARDERFFDWAAHIDELDALGRRAMDAMHLRAMDAAIIAADPTFDTETFLGAEMKTRRAEAIWQFVAQGAAIGAAKMPQGNFAYRRPCAEFHPQIYAVADAGQAGTAGDPFAHYIRSGKPRGPWFQEPIVPSASQQSDLPAPSLRIAIHYHCFYLELFDDFLWKRTINRSNCDLLISTSDDAKAKTLHRSLADYSGGQVDIRVVPNRGRDIGPFLTGFCDAVGAYDVIGHFHSKRSLDRLQTTVAEMSREFMLQHLLGDLHPMMDIVCRRFVEDDNLGIVYAGDPHLPEWDANRQFAEDLATRMGFEEPLPPFFDFPIGTMFWARPRALKPLFDLGLSWADYLEEPAPSDGSILHAIERLLPFVSRYAGYCSAITHIPGVIW